MTELDGRGSRQEVLLGFKFEIVVFEVEVEIEVFEVLSVRIKGLKVSPLFSRSCPSQPFWTVKSLKHLEENTRSQSEWSSGSERISVVQVL